MRGMSTWTWRECVRGYRVHLCRSNELLSDVGFKGLRRRTAIIVFLWCVADSLSSLKTFFTDLQPILKGKPHHWKRVVSFCKTRLGEWDL